MAKRLRDYIDTNDFTQKEIYEILELMGMLKKARYAGAVPKLLKDKTLGMIFEEPSTRTRVSFETAMTLLGGKAQYYSKGDLHLGKKESLYDTAKVLSRMVDGIFCRAVEHQTLLNLSKYSEVPVWNGLTNYIHPTQVMCDMFTMFEHVCEAKRLDPSKITIAFVGYKTSVVRAQMFISTKLGMNFIHIAPKKYWIDEKSLAIAKENVKEAGMGSVTVSEDMNLVKGCDFLVCDTWWWFYKNEKEESIDRYNTFMDGGYQINDAVLKLAGPQALVMHCLPASRETELTNSVIDGPQSIVFDQAENRLTAQLGLLVYFMYPSFTEPSQNVKDYWQNKIEAFMEDKTACWKSRMANHITGKNELDTEIDYNIDDYAYAKEHNKN